MRHPSLAPLLLLATLVGACDVATADGAGDGDVAGAGWSGRMLEEPLARPDFVLTDTRGEPFDFRAETEGDVTLLFFGYTHCPDVCPVHMANLAEVLRDLPLEVSRRVRVVFVTTDPARDTPERLREWLGAMHPRFVGLTGSRAEIRAVEEGLGLAPSVVAEPAESGDPSDYFVGHAAQVLAFSADGPARLAYPWGTRQRDWLRDLPRLVAEGADAPSGD